MIVAINVDGEMVADMFGRAHTMAIADIEQGQIVSWQEEEVGWDIAHDQAPSHEAHHARIAKFMKEQHVEVVVTGHIGPPMVHTLGLMGIEMFMGVDGPARQAAVAAVAELENQ